MVGPWEIRLPPPIAPVRPGDAIRDQKESSKRPPRQPEPESEPPAPDDDPHQIDDYA
ncbi:MAG: hypothetical protein WCZ87_01415 [Thiohalobacteraceae bacterium]